MSARSLLPARPPSRSRAAAAAGAVLGLVLGLLALVTAPASAAVRAADDTPDQGEAGPLRVEMTGLSPAVLPRSGTVTISGTVTNEDRQEWRDVNVYTWVSTTPMSTADQLVEASRTPYDAEVGSRQTDPRTFVSAGDLSPGDSADFTLKVPRSALPIPERAGVYWLGLHALGANDEGRDAVADGRARTFVPVLPRDAAEQPVRASFVLPLRQGVDRDTSGRLREPEEWADLLGPGGRLGRLLGLGESSGSFPLTLLADPAVLDAASLLGRGNDPSATQSATGAPAETANAWLEGVVDLTGRSTTLGLGYADPDVASLAARQRSLLESARQLSGTSFAARGVDDVIPAVAPVDGVLPASSFAALGSGTRVLLSDSALEDSQTSTGSTATAASSGLAAVTRTSAGQPLSVVDSDATARGPGPGAVDDALSYRQRILCEGALRRIDGDRGPMVVAPPADWDPGAGWDRSAFFASLQTPWLRWSALGQSPASAGAALDRSAYTSADRRAQVGDRLVNGTRTAVRTARTFAAALQRPGRTEDAYERLALRGVSYAARDDRDGTFQGLRSLTSSITSRLDRVRITGSPIVTLSGGSGLFSVSMVNDLDRPVRVGIAATTSNADLDLRLPRSVVLPAKQRTTVRIEARSRQTGVRSVQLRPTTTSGTPIGTPLSFNVRDSQVSSLVWAVLAAGAALLAFMIVRRIRRRGLRRDAEPSP